jgi:hypothetical protein
MSAMPSTKPTNSASATPETLTGKWKAMWEKRWEENFVHHGLSDADAKAEALQFVLRAMRLAEVAGTDVPGQQPLFESIPKRPAKRALPNTARP